MRLPFFYGWAIVAVSSLTLTTYGLFYSFSVFFKPLMEEFGWSRGETASAFTIYLAVYTLSAFPMGWLLDRHGPRLPLFLTSLFIGTGFVLLSQIQALWQLYLLFGVVAAFGHGAVYLVPVSTTVRWFNRRRGLVVGIVTSGDGMGILLISLLAQRLIQGYGWRTAFLVLGVLFFALNALSALVVRRHPKEMGLEPYGGSQGEGKAASGEGRDLTLREAVRTQAFLLLYFSFVLVVAAHRMVMVHLVPLATDLGVTAAVAAGALGMVGLGGVGGRLAIGALSDRIGCRRALLLSFVLVSLSFIALLAARQAAAFYGVMLLLGFGYGGFVALFGPLMGELFGVAHLGKIIGVAFTNGALAGLLGPALAGFLFDLTGSYQWPLRLGVAFSLAGLGLLPLLHPPKR